MTATLTLINAKGRRSGGADDFVAYLNATEHYVNYLGGERKMCAWRGAGAQRLGLTGAVEPKDLEQLAQGYDPSGRALMATSGSAKHRAGAEICLSAPKSVSVALALETEENRQKIFDCQDRATDAVVAFIEQEGLIEVNRGAQGKDKLGSKGVVSAGFTHTASRNLDPQLHTHLFVLNVTEGEDGQWSGVENANLFRYTKALGAVYRSALAHELHHTLGYGIEQTLGRDGFGQENGQDNFKVQGVSDELCRFFSTRSKEVEAYKKAHPNARNAVVATRKRKDEPSWTELENEWATRLAYVRDQHPDWLPEDCLALQGDVVRRPSSGSELLAQLHQTEAVITRPKLLERIAQAYVGDDLDALLEREAKMVAGPNVNTLGPKRQPGLSHEASKRPALEYREPRYAADWMMALEKRVHATVERSRANKVHQVPVEVVEEVLARYEANKQVELGVSTFKLKDEQRKMVEHCASETGGMAFVVGWAGTGKTTAAQALAEVLEAHHINGQPLEVLGASPSWKAAGKLEMEAKIPSQAMASIAKGIESGRWTPTERSVLLLDEASLMGTQSFAVVAEAYEQAGGKIIVFGDPHQLQAVEAGSPFRAGIDQCGAVYLNEITRQKTEEGLKLAHATYEGHDDAKNARTWRRASGIGQHIYERYEQAGWITQKETGAECVEALVSDYLDDGLPVGQKVALASTNQEVLMLNAQIRRGLQRAGQVSPRDFEVEVKTRSGVQSLNVAVGDVIRFKAKFEDKANNQEDAVIEHIGKNPLGGLSISVQMTEPALNGKPRKFTFDTLAFDQFIHGYAMTVHGSQGQTVERSYWLADARVDQHIAAVASTRAKQSAQIYLLQEDAEAVAIAMGKHRLKDNALEEERLSQSPAVFEALKHSLEPARDINEKKSLEPEQETALKRLQRKREQRSR